MDIRLEHLKVVRKHQLILEDISVEIHPGLTYLLGLNGSGKSTLLQCLLKTLPYHGTIYLNSEDIRNLSRLELAKIMAFVPQRQRIPAFLTVKEFVLMGRFPYLDSWGSYHTSDREAVGKVIHSLGLEFLADRKVSQLSGGELQRVILAKALSQETSILLLDEPAQFLDPLAREELAHLLQKLAQQGKTILCVTHELEMIRPMEERILALKGGKLVLDSAEEPEPWTKESLMQRIYVEGADVSSQS